MASPGSEAPEFANKLVLSRFVRLHAAAVCDERSHIPAHAHCGPTGHARSPVYPLARDSPSKIAHVGFNTGKILGNTEEPKILRSLFASESRKGNATAFRAVCAI